jgi:hypothetical protein
VMTEIVLMGQGSLLVKGPDPELHLRPVPPKSRCKSDAYSRGFDRVR